MARRLTKKERAEIKDIRDELDFLKLGGEILGLIDAYVRNDWAASEFVTRLTRTESFRTQFPGLIQKGTIAEGLLGQRDATLSVSNLGRAISNYKTMYDAAQDAATKYGFGRITKDRFAALIKSEVSVEEFGARLRAVNVVQNNPAAWDAFKRQAELAGRKVTQSDNYRAVASNRFADIYEATQIQTSGLGLRAKEAQALARQVGSTGDVTGNLQQTLDYVRQNLQTVGPELASQGINAAKLVKILGAQGQGYANEMDIINQTVATRQSMARPGPGIYPQRGTAGGLSLYDDPNTGSYG